MSQRYRGVKPPSIMHPHTSQGCWVLLHKPCGALLPEPMPCQHKARPGRLTCRHHAKYEGPARERLEAEITKEPDNATLARINARLSPLDTNRA